jgi:hypothetical protein
MTAAVCATRGCRNPPASVGPRALTRCVSCLSGARRLDKFNAQIAAVEALPPMVVPEGAWGFRVPGSPRSWNNALIRGRGRPYLASWAREWKRTLGVYAMRARPAGWPLDAAYRVDIRSWFATAAADVDGPVKLVLDALTGIAWRDDKLVVHAPPWKQVDKVAPRLEVVVRLHARSTEG